MGLLSTKEAAQSTPLLIALPVLTIWFHIFCKGRYEPAFVKYPLQVCVCFLFVNVSCTQPWKHNFSYNFEIMI